MSRKWCENKILPFAIRILLFAFCYYVLAILGHKMSVIPGPSTVFWPASGFALVATYFYGNYMLIAVATGLFSYNMGAYSPFDLDGGWLSAINFSGLMVFAVVLQTWFGAWALRKMIGRRSTLETLQHILYFVFLGGFVSCAIASVCGIIILLSMHMITVETAMFHWATWYLGDLMGVIIFGPVFLLFFHAKAVKRSRKIIVSGLLLMVFLITAGLFFIVSQWEIRRNQTLFESYALSIAHDFDERFYDFLSSAYSLQSFYRSSPSIERNEFSEFSKNILQRHDSVQALGWVVSVRSDNYEYYRDKAREESLPEFVIKEFDQTEKDVLNEGLYFPVFYIEPFDINKEMLGLDVGASRKRRKALERARDSGDVIASDPVQLVQAGAEGGNLGILVFAPVYEEEQETKTVEQRQKAIKGFVVGGTRFVDLVNPVYQEFNDKGINIALVEYKDNIKRTVFTMSERRKSGDLLISTPFDFAGKLWTLEIFKSQSSTLLNMWWVLWYTILGGLTFAAICSVFLLYVTGRLVEIEKIVDYRTRALAKAVHEYKKLNEFLDSVLNNLPGMVFVKEAENLSFTMLNKAGEKLLGLKEKDILGKNDYDFFPADQADFFVSRDKKVLNDIKKIDIVEEPIDTKEQGKRWLFTRKIPILDDEGRPQFLLGISEDITERKKWENELECSNKELEQFAYISSHDLKAPLRHMSLSAGLLNETYKDSMDDKGRNLLSTITKSAGRMQEMIESLLEYSRIGRDDDGDIAATDLNEVFEEAKDFLINVIEERNVQLVCEDLPHISGKKDLLVRLFQNLIDNAIKYSKPDQRCQINISARWDKMAYMWELCIEDNGIGIDPQYANRIFDVFRRLHADDEYEGTGIGLSLCKRIVHSHGGMIWLDESYKEGARLCFTLPEKDKEQ